MSLAKFAVNRKITVLMLSILVVILGSVVFFSLGLDMMPDIDFPIISIITSYRGASSNDIEETIILLFNNKYSERIVKNVAIESFCPHPHDIHIEIGFKKNRSDVLSADFLLTNLTII